MVDARLDRPFWTPLSQIWQLPAYVRVIRTEGWLDLVPARERDDPDSYSLRDDSGLGGRVGLMPIGEMEREFGNWARSLMGKRLEVTGCVHQSSDSRSFGLEADGGEPARVLRFFAYAVIPERKDERPPRPVELSSLRDGAHEGRRIQLQGVLAGRRHAALPLSTRTSDTDWVLASGNAAAWMRGRPPEGEGFSLDPDDSQEYGRGLAVVGVLAWYRDVPILHVESVLLIGAARASGTGSLFTLPLGDRLDPEDQTIEVRFSSPMDETSFEGRVELRDADGRKLAARWEYDPELWRLLVSPSVPLPPGSELELRLRVGVRSETGDEVRREPDAEDGLVLARTYRVPESAPVDSARGGLLSGLR
jgi:hypothetical protein